MKKTSHLNAIKKLIIDSNGKGKSTLHPNKQSSDGLVSAKKEKRGN